MYNENDCFSTYFNELNDQSLRLCEQILYKNILLKVFIYYESIVLFKHVFNFLLYYKVLCHRILYVWMACNCCDYNWWEKGLTLLYFSWFNSNAIPFLVKTVNCQKDSQIAVSETNTKSYAKLQWVCI